MNPEVGALQLRHEYGVIIDSDAFLGALTKDTGSQRVKGGLWSLGLGHRQSSDQSTTLPMDYQLVDQDNKQVSMFKKWERYSYILPTCCGLQDTFHMLYAWPTGSTSGHGG